MKRHQDTDSGEPSHVARASFLGERAATKERTCGRETCVEGGQCEGGYRVAQKGLEKDTSPLSQDLGPVGKRSKSPGSQCPAIQMLVQQKTRTWGEGFSVQINPSERGQGGVNQQRGVANLSQVCQG